MKKIKSSFFEELTTGEKIQWVIMWLVFLGVVGVFVGKICLVIVENFDKIVLLVLFFPVLWLFNDKQSIFDFSFLSTTEKIIRIVGIVELVLIPAGGFLLLYFADKGYLL